MPEQQDDQEISAVGAIKTALSPLDPEARERVLSAALALLGMSGARAGAAAAASSDVGGTAAAPDAAREAAPQPASPIPDIRQLKAQKQPKSDREMAVLVAYYLTEEAPSDVRKDFITAEDILTQFKQAGYRRPSDAGQTLRNAKHAGYLESAGQGKFRLSPVGYNLAAHGLPRSESEATSRRPARGSAAKNKRSPKASTTKRPSSRRE